MLQAREVEVRHADASGAQPRAYEPYEAMSCAQSANAMPKKTLSGAAAVCFIIPLLLCPCVIQGSPTADSTASIHLHTKRCQSARVSH